MPNFISIPSSLQNLFAVDLTCVINRPGVAGAVLHTASSLIN